MGMQTKLSATDVRKHWSQFNDDVIREGPRFVKRNRDEWAALSFEHLKVALSQFTFKVTFSSEEDGTVTATLNGFDMIENGGSEDEALELITDELIEYANKYQDNFKLYFNSPDRRNQFPYIMNVLIQENIEGVRELIDA